MTGYFDGILPGCDLQIPGFPFLRSFDLTSYFEGGVKVFQFEARGRSLIVRVHPVSPMMPEQKAMLRLMTLPCVQIDYPCAHLGKIVAVHTAEERLMPNGKAVANDARDHENLVRELTTNWRQKGLSMDFGKAGEGAHTDHSNSCKNDFLQPVAEVKVVESTYLDSMGRTQFHYKKTPEYRLLHLVQPVEPPASLGRRSMADRLPIGSSVLCIERESDCFGQTGVVDRSGADSEIEALFEKGLTGDEHHELQRQIQCIVQHQHQSLKWYPLSQVAKKAGLPEYVLRFMFGSLMMRSPENVREDMGMNLIYEAKKDGSAFCLPAFSMKSPTGWCFSDLAVEAAKDYSSKYPELIEALQQRWNNDRDLEASWIFWQSQDASYTFGKMVKYVNSCAFKKLRFVPAKHMALTPATIAEIASAVDAVYERVLSRPLQSTRIRGCKHLYRAEDPGSRPPAELLPQNQELTLGQRVVYIKPHGLVPCGAKGTLVAVYGTGALQECEVLLDEDSFGSTNLHGRVASMRGIRATCVSFMPLQPMITSNVPLPPASTLESGLSTSAKSSAPSKKDASQRRPQADVVDNKISEIQQRSECDGKANGKGGRYRGPNASNLSKDLACPGGASKNREPENSPNDSKYWGAMFDELVNLGTPHQSSVYPGIPSQR
jgi:hypothetical protein